MNKKGIVIILIIFILVIAYFIFRFNMENKTSESNTVKENNLSIDIRNEDARNNISQTPINIDGKNMDTIPDPDEIIYYLDNEKIIVDKNDEKYLTIIEMNKARTEYNFGLLEMNMPSVSEIEEYKDKYLEYKYNDGDSIYFTLLTSSDEAKTQYIVIKQDNKYFESGVYGFSSSPCDELVKFLKE